MFNQLMKQLKSRKIKTTAYHQEANGLVEHFHHSLKSALRGRMNQLSWLEHLPLILLGLWTAVKEDIKCSSAEMMYSTNAQTLSIVLSLILTKTFEHILFCRSAYRMANLAYNSSVQSQRATYVPKLLQTYVVYWPMTRVGCQNKKCTYVNNRCIRSRNIRIITLTVYGLNECNCDAHKKVDVELLYNSVKTGSQLVWRPDPLVTRCGRESQHPPEWAPRPWLSSPGERERNAVMANRVRVNMLQFCLVSDSLSHTTLSNKVRGIFF